MNLRLVSWLSACALAMGAASYAAEPFSGYTVSDEGAWCWFADPRAIHYADGANIDASYLGYIDVHGNIRATQYDFKSGTQSEVLVRSYFQPDDHNNPTFLVLPDKRILIIYSRHTDEAAFYYRISTKPGDITSLGNEYRLATANNTTYPSPFIMSDDPNHIYLCWRGIGWHPTIGRLTMPAMGNDEMTFDWGPFQIVQSTGARPYAKYFSNGKDKIYVTYTTGHPDNEQPNWVYFNVININNGNGATLEDIKGTKLSTIANGKFNVEKTSSYKNNYPYTVVDAPSDKRDWVWQTQLDTDGNPVIAMVRINGGKSEHIYHYAKWTGSAWRVTELANGGGRFHSSNTEYCYSGGMALDPENVKDIYLSIPTNGANGSVYEIWKYTVDNDGKVVDKQPITSDSQKNNVRPWMLPGSKTSPLRLAWMNGDYYYWLVQKNYPKGYPTSVRCDYKWTENATVPAAAKSASYTKTLTPSESVTESFASAASKFAIRATVKIDGSNYGGTIITSDKFSYALDKTSVLPYATVNGTRYNSTNKLYTSDGWATNSSGTGGDNWPTKLGQFAITITYDGANLCIYRSGLLDQKIEVAGLTAKDVTVGGFDGNVYDLALWTSALTPMMVKGDLAANAIASIRIPETTSTDLVLPATVGGNQIAWASSAPEIIAPNGTFVSPASDTQVTLTATIAGSDYTYNVLAKARDIKANLLARYEFDEAVDGVVADLSGRSNDLRVFGSAKVNGALDLTANTAAGFDTNGYALAPAALMDGLRSYTFLLDVAPASLASQPRLYDFGINSANSLFLRASALSAGIKYAGGTTTMVTSSTALEAGKTYKLAVTFDARTRTTTIYINGAPAVSGTENVNEPYMIADNGTCSRNYIGRTQWWDGSYAADNIDFKGTIDNFAIYNTALTAEEIRTAQGFAENDESLNIDCSDRLTNPGFEGAYTVMPNSGVTSDRAIYIPDGWTVTRENDNENDITILNSSDLQASLFSAVTTNQGGGKNAYFVRHKWGTPSLTIKQAIADLPAAIYRVKAEAWQSGTGGQATVWAQAEGQNMASGAPAQANELKWQSAEAKVMANGIATITLGGTATHTENGVEKLIGFDNFQLHDVTANASDVELYDLIKLLVAAAESLNTDNALNPITLGTAIEGGKDAKADAGHDSLFDAYKALRDAIYNERNGIKTDPEDGIALLTADQLDPAQPVYDLNGRIVLPAGQASRLSTLPAGIYIHASKKYSLR